MTYLTLLSASGNTEPLANSGASIGIFIIVILVLIALAAFAFWGNRGSRANLDEDLAENPEENIPPDEVPDATDENPDMI